MNRATIQGMIKAFAATANDPALSDEEIDLIIDMSRRQDINGKIWSDATWVETYDINWGVSRAWEMKAGKAAGLYTFLAGGQQFIRSDMIRHCQQMADRWKRGVYMAAPVTDSQSPVQYSYLYAGYLP